MSVLSETAAVVSLGRSCQTAIQVRRHCGIISDAFGETFAPQSLPFDWNIMRWEAIGQLVLGLDRFPPDPSALTCLRTERPLAPLWREKGVVFWHDFGAAIDLGEDGGVPLSEGSDIAIVFDAEREKYRRRYQKFDALREKQRRHFIVSNTQNNLDFVTEVTGWAFSFAAAEIRQLKEVLDEVFGPGNALHVVCYDRTDFSLPEGTGIHIHRFEVDSSHVDGDDVQWAALLGRLPSFSS